MSFVKLTPHILSWFGMVLILLRGFRERRMVVTVAGNAGFIAGAAGAFFLFSSYPGSLSFGIVRSALGVCFSLLWVLAVAVMYRTTGRGGVTGDGYGFFASPVCAGATSALAGGVAGAVCVCRLPGGDAIALTFVVLVLSTGVIAAVARFLEPRLPVSVEVTPSGMAAALVALLMFSSSSILRLDLFSPLSMKVMKGIHDFVHQFMESVLIPDHVFVQPVVWKYIGFLFGKEVGFWGGMILWFTPPILITGAIYFARLPSVAHIRQGARRRRVLAAALSSRRVRLAAPLFSIVMLAAAAYQSRFPNVEYWDPKPLVVTANQAGEIVISKKGDVELEDGKLHKYLYKQGGREARFFVLMTPAGQLTVDLDACAICKPDGYGQADGSVICYYCKTLIPLETVGKPGGCNPVPISFSDRGDSVVIDGMTLINTWGATVQATAKVSKDGGAK